MGCRVKARAWSPKALIRSLTVLALLGTCVPAWASDICTAIAIRDVPAIESPDTILKAGEIDRAVTEFRIDKRTGRTSLCSHGGECYPTHVKSGGDLLEALRLQRCKVSYDHPYETQTVIIYGVDPIRSETPPAQLRYNDLFNRFSELGLCSACADNVTQYFMKKPDSACAKLALSALEGNPDALRTLTNDPPYCTWHY